jgi:hypothetical protein
MRTVRSCLLMLGALMIAGAAFAAAAPGLAAPPPAPPVVSAPAAAPGSGAGQQPVPMATFPGCQSGYFPANQECVVCGSGPYGYGYESCTTCANLWTDDQYTVCSYCDFVGVCTPP